MSTTHPKRPTRKRSFLLIELFVALGLLSLCLLPILKTQLGIVQHSYATLRTLQEEAEVGRRFCALKEALYEHRYSWEALRTGIATQELSLRTVDHSTKQTDASFLLVEATLFVGKKPYVRTLSIQKTARPYAH